MVAGQVPDRYLVVSQTLNLRNGPGTEYEVIQVLAKGDLVTVIEKNQNGWWLVDFQRSEGYVFNEFLKIDPYNGWETKTYKSGSTPECENVIPKYDFTLDNYLRVNVGSNTDVVIKLMKYNSSECIRIVYIRSGDVFEIKNIPEGRYYLKIAYGKDYRQKIADDQCIVKFMQNPIYEKGTDIMDYTKIKKPDEKIGNDIYESWDVPSFELSLDIITTNSLEEDTFNSNNISETEFNK